MGRYGQYLDELRCEGERQLAVSVRVTVGMGTCGRAAGADDVLAALEQRLAGIDGIRVDAVGCKGLCFDEPLVEVHCDGGLAFTFGQVDVAKANELAEVLVADNMGNLPVMLAAHLADTSFLDGQQRRVMANCGVVSPASLEQYVARGGYTALAQALESEPAAVIDTIGQSNLRGRGGAGFPTGKKWRECADNDAEVRYFIVNGDEGDPGAYMDRGLLESDPFRVIEGLTIGCYAVGAHLAYFFVRAEYPLAVATIKSAIVRAREVGLLGENIMGSGFDLEVRVVRGAGAFLCGESTAMVSVLENGPCTTRPKPPHLTERGLWDKPTCVNNVETLANVSIIVEKGAEWFQELGTQASPGTKIFSVTGAVERGGLVEVALGSPLSHIVVDVAHATHPKAVQIGGPSGAILPTSLVDLEISYEGLSGINGMMGSGGFVVIGDNQCVVDTASYLVHFSARQSCRKCKPCRDGLDECAELFERIASGQGAVEDLERLEAIAERNCSSKLCGLGRTALSPVLSSLHYFRDEYEAHLEKCCPGLVCAALVSYEIDQTKCQGERCCLLTCPSNAVKGKFGKPGHIVARLCRKCGMCSIACPYDAIRKVSPAAY